MAEVRLTDDVIRGLLDAAPDAIVVVDESGRIVLVNDQAEQLLRFRRFELLGMRVEELLPEDLRASHRGHRKDYHRERRSRPMGAGLDLRARRSDGGLVPVEIALSPLRTPVGLLTIAAIRDVSDRRELEARTGRAQQALALANDRERIARDLHDHVIQQLFATGMALEAVLHEINEPRVRRRVDGAVAELDDVIRDIRTAIFELGSERESSEGVRGQVTSVARDASRSLGFKPRIHFDGPVDSTVPEAVRAHLVATLREALSNVARHAQASKVAVTVEATGRVVTLWVRDDGIGLPLPHERPAGQGLANLSKRATQLGGTFETTNTPNAGTQLRWTVPLQHSP